MCAGTQNTSQLNSTETEGGERGEGDENGGDNKPNQALRPIQVALQCFSADHIASNEQHNDRDASFPEESTAESAIQSPEEKRERGGGKQTGNSI